MKKLLLIVLVAFGCASSTSTTTIIAKPKPAPPTVGQHRLPKRGLHRTNPCAGADTKQALASCLNRSNTKLLGATRPANPNPYWAVPDWFFSSAGSDNNSCIDAGHPCATPEEVYARWGTFTPPLSGLVTFHILTDIASTHLFHSECIGSATLSEPSELDLVGATITLASGSVVAATNMDRVNPPPLGTLPTIDLGVPAAAFVGNEFVDVKRGSMGWIISASGNVVTTGPVMQLQPNFDGGFMFLPPELNNITIGDTWEVRRNIHAEITSVSATPGCLSGIWRIDANPVSDTIIINQGLVSAESSFGFEDLYGGSYINNSIGEHAALGGQGGSVIGGITTDFAVVPFSFREGTLLDGDVTFTDLTIIGGLTAYGTVHLPALNSGLVISAGAELAPDNSTTYAANAILWGGNTGVGGQLIVDGLFLYTPPMTTAMPGSPNLFLGSTATNSQKGIAEDLAANPVQYYFRGPMTTTLLDTPIGGAGGTGFGGIALGFDGVSSIVSITSR